MEKVLIKQMLYSSMKKNSRNVLPKIFLSLGSDIKSCYSLSLHSLFKNTRFHGGTLWSSLESLRAGCVGKDLAAQAAAAPMCRAGGLVLPAKRRSPQKPALWSIVGGVVGNCTVPTLARGTFVRACVFLCVRTQFHKHFLSEAKSF